MPSAVSQPALQLVRSLPSDPPIPDPHEPAGPSFVPRYLEVLLLAVAAAAILVTRLRYLPTTLEDVDSVNFDLGVHNFNPFGDQPHPPGYAVFIGIAKLVHPWFDSHAAGLAFPSALFSAIALFPLYGLFRHLMGRPQAALACTLVVFNPLFWLNSVRPMSDITGFAVVLGAQCLLVRALAAAGDTREPHRLTWCLGVVLAGFAVGVRVQAGVLVAPVLVLGFFKLRHLRLHTVAVFTATCALWIVPTVVASGGVQRLIARQTEVVAEAWLSEPLVSEITLERMYRGAVDSLVAPWGSTWLAASLLVAAAAGLPLLWRHQRRSLAIVLLLFAPYALYHYTLQATALRYTIPILPVVAVPASMALALLVRRHTLGLAAIAVAFVFVSTCVTMPALDAYAGGPSPPAGAVRYLQQIALTEPDPVVAGNYVFNRYLPELAASAQILRTKPNQEWRALNRFWVAGERRSIWFLRDPGRTILRLKDPQAQTRIASWQWPDPLMRLIRGARPTRIELVRLDPPRWFAESGFLLTGEAGPADRVANEQHLLFVRSDLTPHVLVVSGTSAQKAVVTVVVGEQRQSRWLVDNHFSVRVTLPPDSAEEPYVPVRLVATGPLLLTNVTVGADAGDLVLLATGFYALERDEVGREFRWMGPRAEVALSGSGSPLRVTVAGLVPSHHFSHPLMLRVELPGWEGREYQLLGPDFHVNIDVPPSESGSTTTMTLWTSESFVPDEVERNGDRRTLALRIYELRAGPVKPDEVEARF